jgi:hypothetical protein
MPDSLMDLDAYLRNYSFNQLLLIGWWINLAEERQTPLPLPYLKKKCN